ncbi:MAG TPA: hypothetical protein PLA50_01585, partial [Bacteroidia bacterium]|nr:hypothetical protein [Bacteroidia bacterium]
VIEVFAGRDLLMRGGGTTDMANADNINTFAQIGHGWDTANASGTIHVTVRRDLDMKGGVGKQAHALIGHASRGTVALSDKITVNVTGATTMTAGSGEDDYVKIGHAARSGTVTAGGEICFNTASLVMTAGTGADGKRAFAQIGHGGYGVTGPFSGKIVVSSLAGISMNGGAGADGQYVQIGHGGVSSAGAMSGDVYVIAQGGDLLLQGGGAANAYAMIGHGADTTSSGTRQGGIHLFADGTITAADGTGSNSRAHVIHRSGSGLSDANYLGGGDGFQLVSNGGASYSNASLEGVGVMASRNFDAGVSFAFSNDIDIVINSGAQITVNTDRDLVMMTGGNLTVNRSYQNAGTGGVVLVAGWRGGGSFSGGRVEFQGVGFCQPTIVSSTAAGFNGCGNFGLGADGVSARSLVVGSASQTAALRIGSRGGQNTFAGYGVTLNAGAASAPTQLGYHHTNASDTGAITGGLAVQVRGGGLTLKGGANDAHAQIGHSSSVVVDIDADIAISFCEPGDLRLDGGAAANAYAKIGHGANVAGGNLSGDVVIGSPTGKAGAVFLNSGNASGAYTQIGHGGSYGTINSIGLSGSIALHATGALEMTSKAGGQSYTMIGHGGRNSLGEKGGADESIVVSAASVAMTAAGGHAMIGHGSQWQAGGNITGDISVTATAGSIRVQGGGRDAFASIGHGGLGTSTAGAMTGDITVKATGGGLYLTAGTNAADNKNSYARVGHGAFSVNGHLSGDIDVDVDGDIVMHSGGDTRNNHADNVNAHTQIGHGGHRPDTSDGTIRIRAGGDMEMLAGIGAYSYSMVGHGGWGDSGASVGEISLAVGGDLTMTSGSGEDAFTQIGHGGSNRPGNHVGDLSVYVGGDLAVNGGTHATRTDAVIGHGGRTVAGNHTGHIRLRVLGDTSLTDGTGGWAMLGHVGTGTVLANSDFSFVTGSLSSVGANYGLGNTISRHYASNRVDIGVQQGDLLIAGSAATASHAHDLNLFAGGSVTIATRMQNMANGNVSIIGGWDGTTGLLQNLDLARLPVLTQLQLSPDTVMADVSAFGAGASLVNIGTGSHAAGIAVGSKNGRTLAAANGVRVTGSTAAEIYSLLGYHTDATNDTTVGRVVVEAKESGVTVQGGGTGAYAQIGHGGSGGNTNLKNLGGDISVRADRGSVVGDVRVLSGTGDRANAQIGLGGRQNDGSHTGRIVVIGAGVEVRSGAGSAQIGHGGFQGTGTYTGDVFINFDPDANGGAGAVRGGGGDLIVQAGDGFDDFAMIGHGGVVANGGPRSGNIRIGEAANVFVHAGSNRSATAQIGHAGVNNGNLELKGDIDIHTSGNLSLKGGFGAVSNLLNFAQIGHGGAAATGVKTGNINITALGTSVLLAAGTNTQGTEGSHAQIGHGGDTSGGNATGTITLLAPNALVELEGGTWIRNHAKIGHGGYNSTGNYTGSIDLLAGAGLSLTGGSGTDAFAQVGHGGAHSNGDMGGDIRVRSGGDLLMQGCTNANDTDVLIGHGFVGTTGTRSGNVSIRTEGTTSLLEGAAARALLGHAGSGSGAGSTDFAFVTDRLVQSTVLYGLGDTIAMMLPRGAIDIGVRQGDLRIDGVGGIANSAKAIDLFAGGNVVLNSQAQNSGAGSASIVAGWDGATGLVEQYPTSTTAPVIVVLGLEIADVLADDASWGNGGKVTVGDGAQAAVGSAGGATTVLGHAVDVRGSSGGYALIGSLPASGVSPTGDITVKAKEGGIAVEAGNGTSAYAQIGHRAQGSLVSALSGRILVDSGAGLALKGGAGLLSYAQIGHGGNSGDVGSIGGAV